MQVWFEDKFLHTTKGKISAVIDALHQDIVHKNDELNQVFKQKEDFETKLSLFLKRFQGIKERFNDIEETIEMRNEVMETLRKGADRFPQDSDWMIYDRIRSEVEDFFDYIDSRLDELRLSVDQAVKQVARLYKNFEFKRMFKVRMEKFLHLLLNQSTNEKGKLKFPQGISTKSIPVNRPSLYLFPDQLHIGDKKSQILEITSDKEKLEQQRQKQKETLWRDQKTASWTKKLKEELNHKEAVRLEDWFFKILEEDKDIELSVNVIHKVMNAPEYKGKAEKPDLNGLNRKDIVVWKMKLESTNS
ncbi:hypothetical protein E1171_15720 [Cytophagales bacterium RKSG123]|nr:hypothetical protein [Xanthovirga aplysinae]